MREKGRIIGLNGRMLTVLCGEIAACFGCMNQECKSNKRIITAENRNHLDVSLGRLVEVETHAAGAFVQFLQAVLPPLAGFAAAYLLMLLVFPASTAAIRAAVGFAGLFLAGLGFYLYRKKVPVKNNPCVIKVLDETESEGCSNASAN